MIRIIRSTMSFAVFTVVSLSICGHGQFASAAYSSSVVPQVQIVTASDASPLEKQAVQMLDGILRRLYQASVQVVTAYDPSVASTICVGCPKTSSVMQAWKKDVPAVSDQGHFLKSVAAEDHSVLLIGGGSPAAAYWAVSEYAHRLGIRSLLYGDLDPVSPPEFTLGGFNVVLEPTLKSRAWRTLNDFPIGPESWGLAEYQQTLRQLAKQKYNRVIISVYAWQPFVHYEFENVAKRTGVLWYGWNYPVSGDTAGRSVFSGAKLFENPDFVGTNSYEERIAAGQKLIRGIITTAHELGMSAGLSVSPLEFPREFADVLPGAQTIPAPEALTISPGASQLPDDPTLIRLAKTQLRAYLKTYPELDAIYLSLSEFPEWGSHAEASWGRLSARFTDGSFPSLETLTEAARQRSVVASGDRGVRALRGNLVALDFLNTIRSDESLFVRPDGRELEVNLAQIDPALYGYLSQLLPPRTGGLHFVDYTSRRVLQNRELLTKVPSGAVSSSLILTLADDNIGVLPQTSHTSLTSLQSDLKQLKWNGFSTRYWCIGDLDLSSWLISRGSFGEGLAVESAVDDMIATVCGEGVVDRVSKAMGYIEEATSITDQNDLSFSFPVPDMIIRHYLSDEEPPEWWSTVREHYLNAMNEMYRANTRAREGGRSYTLYHARRCEFGYEYMNCVEAVRKAGIAKRKNEKEEHEAQLSAAVDAMNAALSAMAAVARSNSDRGVIAVLNEYGYRPLIQELEAVENASESP
jgi:hypothetical protein